MPDTKPIPPAGYKLFGTTDVPANAKLSPDIEDRRDWGSFRNGVEGQKQDFLGFWRDFRATYPDFHTAYKTVLDGIMGKNKNLYNTPQVSREQINVASSPQPVPNNQAPRKIGETKQFKNGKTGVWDGHGWVAQ